MTDQLFENFAILKSELERLATLATDDTNKIQSVQTNAWRLLNTLGIQTRGDMMITDIDFVAAVLEEVTELYEGLKASTPTSPTVSASPLPTASGCTNHTMKFVMSETGRRRCGMTYTCFYCGLKIKATYRLQY